MSRNSLVTALLVSLVASAAHASAPADSIKPRFTLGATQVGIGFARHNLSSLNSRMAAAGLPVAATSTPTIGIGADVRADRLLFGATYQSLLTRNRSAAGYRTRSSGSVSLFDAGFAVVKTRRLAVYSLLGVGAAHLSLNIKELGDISFDDALRGPGREMGLSGTAALMHTGLLVERTFDRKGSQLALALRVGIARSVGDQRWDSDENRVSDGPVGLRGSYMRLALSRPIGRRRDSVMPMAATLVQTLAR